MKMFDHDLECINEYQTYINDVILNFGKNDKIKS